MNKIIPGQEIKAQIVAITNDCVFIDLNAKSEGIIDKTEFLDKEGNCSLQEGDTITAFFMGERNGEMRFTTQLAADKLSQGKGDTSMLEQAWKSGIPVEGKVEKEIKGGFEIKLGNARAFCPYSQMGFRQKEEPAAYIGRVLSFKIQEYKENGKNILVSNRVVLEEEHRQQLTDISKTISVGQVVQGKVESLQSFGAFVDIGGFKALLPISQVGRGRVADISEVLTVGQEVEVEVISTDWAKERFSVSLKSLMSDPWDTVKDKYPVDSKHTGTIARVADFGLFITLESGVDGLLHISELQGENRNTNLRVKYKAGDSLDVAIKAVDLEERRISLRSATSSQQDKDTEKYLGSQKDDGDTYNPFAALLKKK